MILGLTGPVQNGKIQLTHVFKECGWVFHDLNDVVYARREKGSSRHSMYQTLFPGSLDDEGVETGVFYRSMTPTAYRRFLSEDMIHVLEAAQAHCRNAKMSQQRIVLSWEYLARIANKLPIDHTLLFGSDRERWYDRMKQRAVELGWGKAPTDETLTAIVRMLDVEPETIDREVRACTPPSSLTTIDVSPEDWGAAELKKFLGNLP